MAQGERLSGTTGRSWALALSGLVLVGLLGGCGGDGSGSVVSIGDSPTPTPTPTPSGISGVVADGYLQLAKVCLDVNGNKVCDIDEPWAESGAGGQFTITAEELAKLPEGIEAAAVAILVEVPEHAIDEDTMAPVGKVYKLAAPAGKPEFVSPMTTLVQSQLETNPALSVEQAETLVKGQIGIEAGASLFEDYVVPKTEGLDAAAAEARAAELRRVHKVAQVVAVTLAGMQSDLQQAATNAGQSLSDPKTLEALTKLVVEEVMSRLQTIAVTVDAALETAAQGGTVFNPQTVATTVTTTAPVLTTNLVQQIEAKSTVVAKSSFAKMLEGEGSYWLEQWMDNGASRFEYGNVKLPAGTNTPQEAHFTWMNGAWQADSDSELPDYILTATGWQTFSDSAANYTVTFNATDGSALLTHTATGLKEILSAVELDLGGKSHQAIAGELAKMLVDPTAIFPAGAKGYRLTFVPQQDIYTVETWTNAAGADDNYLRYWNQNQEVSLTSLAQVQSVFASGSGNYLHLDGDNGASLAVQFGSDGKLYCFKQPWDWRQPPVTLEKAGSWSQVQAFGQTFIKLLVPEIYKAGFDLDGDPILVEKDGLVKRGEYRPAGMVIVEDELNFNKLAFDSLAGNLNYAFVPTGGGVGIPGPGTGTEPGPGTNPGPGTGTDPGPGDGGGTPIFAYPPPLSDVLAISPGEFLDRTFLVREGEFGLTLVTFRADGTLSGLDSVETTNGMEVSTFEGTWRVNTYGHLVAIGPDGETTTLRKLRDSAAEAMHIYYEDQKNDQPLGSGYQVFETTMAFADPSGLTLVGSDGVTVVFDPVGNGNSGWVTDSLDNSSNSFDWNLQDGVLSLHLDNGEVVTLYLLLNGSSQEVFSIVGFDRDGNGAVLDVFHDVMTVASEGGAPQ